MSTPATLVFLQMAEPKDQVLPSDATSHLADLHVDTGLAVPPVALAFSGFGRSFSDGHALDGVDLVPGTTLATRDVTVQAIVNWDFVGQNAYGQPGTIVARGKGNAASEFVSYAVELRVVDTALSIGELRLWWQDKAGNVKTQFGGYFVAPSSGFLLLTAVRHWVSSFSVELRYYVGDQLVGEFLTPDGDIGGGTTGTFCLGTRYSAGTPGRFFVGVIDQLRVLNHEITAEEIAATWDRLSRLQPRGYRAVRDLFQPGAPITSDPSSRIQKLFRIAGHLVGYAAAQVENVRQNLLPDRAYGPTLEQWERITGEAPRAPDTAPVRRKRVLSHFRQRAGASVPGVTAAVADLLALSSNQVQMLAFSAEVDESFDTLDPQRWWSNPSAKWSAAGGVLVANFIAADDVRWTAGSQAFVMTPLEAMGGTILQANILPVGALPNGGEVGIALWDFARHSAILFGIDFNGINYRLVHQRYERNAPIENKVVDNGTWGNVPSWLRITVADGDSFDHGVARTTLSLGASSTSATAGFANVASGLDVPNTYVFAGLYVRTVNATLGGSVGWTFDDLRLRVPRGTRQFHWYVLRDPTLPGTPDMPGATRALRLLRQAHTYTAAITNKQLLCDDPTSQCDVGPLGGI
jgi:hypothetical protein